MLGCRGKPETIDGKSFEPLVSYHVQAISIGNLIDEETPMIWRGPMVTSALEQLLTGTKWRNVDYLVVDLPPGTGDIQLTLCQKIPVSGAIIVTTPQDIALLDARKALKMFEKVEVPVLGIVENMSMHVCSQCGHEEPIFGQGGGAAMAAQYQVDLLGSLPLEIGIREGVDNGRPTVAMDPGSRSARIFHDLARKIAAQALAAGQGLLGALSEDRDPEYLRMSIKSDRWIRRMAAEHGMIEPFEPGQVRANGDGRLISYGTSSYGYDIRCANEFKIFTNINTTIVDPKNFDPQSFVDVAASVCIIPPNSFALARTVEYFRIPRNVLTICLGKSTYARCGIIVNVTPIRARMGRACHLGVFEHHALAREDLCE